jgi:hypothetical protein
VSANVAHIVPSVGYWYAGTSHDCPVVPGATVVVVVVGPVVVVVRWVVVVVRCVVVVVGRVVVVVVVGL